ncbi:isochorismatase family protein [Nonomuraea sp. NPDC050790]|uniref:isochorismatase family protein n=1 Tax=Nonomuraea sp. NPDC050790 TaxID=3364371 RepID=UPI0037AE2243
MTNTATELTIDNSAVVLIDHQPWVASMLQTDGNALLDNVTLLARAAKLLEVPTVLTTVGAEGGPLPDPIFTQISDVFPDITPIDRTTTAAWSDPDVRAAVEATDRRKLIMAGLSTEVCLAQTVLAALKDGFEVYFASDCSAGVTVEGHEDGKARMIQAGAVPINVSVVISEWTPDYTSPERALLTEPMIRHGGTISMAVQYVMAQNKA